MGLAAGLSKGVATIGIAVAIAAGVRARRSRCSLGKSVIGAVELPRNDCDAGGRNQGGSEFARAPGDEFMT